MASIIWSPIVNTGLSEVIGSWKIMEMSFPLTLSIFFSSSSIRSLPSKRSSPLTILPGGIGISLRRERPVTLFPHPDSPTRLRISPGKISKLTSSTALTTPSSVKNWVVRERTSQRGFFISNFSLNFSRFYCQFYLSIVYCSSSFVHRLSPSSQPRIKRIAQSFPQKIERENRHQNGKSRKECQPPGIEDIGPSFRKDIPPAWSRRLNPESQETEPCLHEGGCGDIERGGYKDRCQAIGQDVPEDNPSILHAERPCRLDKISLSQGEELCAHKPRGSHPGGDANDQHDIKNTWTHKGDHRQDEKKCGETEHNVNEAHENGADPSGIVS